MNAAIYTEISTRFMKRLRRRWFSDPRVASRKEEKGFLEILCVPFGPRFSRLEEIGGLRIPLRSFWPTLHCRRVAGVSPLLSIGWWYLSSESPKRHCCRVSAAGKRRAWFLPDDRHTASLVGLRGGWRHARMKSASRVWIPVSCAWVEALFYPQILT
ncbi:uncharacterized protein TNCV_887541 [Trichonephila clavipes]|uniref:Uncharacterized protein n=1 Tax=Trichonephila clavipes TaxID=2585209 RepID=A0A8X6R7Y3_TRICX|nr:uncharacterized protein TNCV_887541 [Trichonephila clavipes]